MAEANTAPVDTSAVAKAVELAQQLRQEAEDAAQKRRQNRRKNEETETCAIVFRLYECPMSQRKEGIPLVQDSQIRRFLDEKPKNCRTLPRTRELRSWVSRVMRLGPSICAALILQSRGTVQARVAAFGEALHCLDMAAVANVKEVLGESLTFYVSELFKNDYVHPFMNIDVSVVPDSVKPIPPQWVNDVELDEFGAEMGDVIGEGPILSWSAEEQ
eukprot:g1478.t1